jgi:hypothetical protein
MYTSLKILNQVPEPFCLKDIIGLLLFSCQPVSEKQHNHFVNDIPPELEITMDKQIFCMLISSVLQEVASICRDTCLHVFAHSYDSCLIIGITDGSYCVGYAVYPGFETLFINGKLSGMVNLQLNKGKDAFGFSQPIAA